MQFLPDQPISPRLAAWLIDYGHRAEHVRDRGKSRSTDEEIFAVAVAEDGGRDRPGLILFRAGALSDEEMLRLLQVVLNRVPEETLQRSVVIVEQTRLRIASLPVRPDLE